MDQTKTEKGFRRIGTRIETGTDIGTVVSDPSLLSLIYYGSGAYNLLLLWQDICEYDGSSDA